MLLKHADRFPDSGDSGAWTTHGFIGCCCGSYVHSTFESWLLGHRGIDVFLSEENHDVPESNEQHHYAKIALDDGSWVYIKESYYPNYAHKQSFSRDKTREDPVHPLCCSVYSWFSPPEYSPGYSSHWAALKEKYQYFFFIYTTDQLPHKLEVMEGFGTLIYESPKFAYNNNTMVPDRLKLFIAEKV